MYYAHSGCDPKKSDWQTLRDHLAGTAERAAAFGEPIGLSKAASLAGLLHDLGKYTAAFQARLEGAPKPVDHSTAGAVVVENLPDSIYDKVVAELIAYAIAGHHAGLPDKTGEFGGSLKTRLQDFSLDDLDPVWETELDPDATGLLPNFTWDKPRAPFQFGMLGRIIFSCLVDADFKDTESFYAQSSGYTPDRSWPKLGDVLPDMLSAFDAHMNRFGEAKTDINRLRADILSHVRDRAGETPGLFSLTVPTGGGKTLASLGFALDHAYAHGLERIIYCIPFTSIIDQTAATFRDVFREISDDDLILEHHSAIDRETLCDDNAPEGRGKLRLAMEDWAAPLVVSTNVQFFESLFAARPSRCRKLHNIANSVIILDEAQTLPRALLAPTVQALHELVRNYGCSIVLCTATQPALDNRNFPESHPLGLPLSGRELAPDPTGLARKLKRVTIRHAGPMDDDSLLAELTEQSQGLVIVNSRKHALALYKQAQDTGLNGLIHLTTRQCAVDRQAILKTIRQRLADGLPCRVVATSLVEAGVDLDFPAVWRAEAGLDQIAQAAGRCNREGRAPASDSIVTVFAAPDNPPPPEVQGLCGDFNRIASKHDDLLSPAAIEDFFGEVYWRLRDDVDKHEILNRFRIGRNETDFEYRTVAGKFRMIESGMVPVIIALDAAARNTIERLNSGEAHAGAAARKLQPYTVQVPPRARAELLSNRHVNFIREDNYGDQFAVLTNAGLYTREIGLLWENAAYLELENMII